MLSLPLVSLRICLLDYLHLSTAACRRRPSVFVCKKTKKNRKMQHSYTICFSPVCLLSWVSVASPVSCVSYGSIRLGSQFRCVAKGKEGIRVERRSLALWPKGLCVCGGWREGCLQFGGGVLQGISLLGRLIDTKNVDSRAHTHALSPSIAFSNACLKYHLCLSSGR